MIRHGRLSAASVPGHPSTWLKAIQAGLGGRHSRRMTGWDAPIVAAQLLALAVFALGLQFAFRASAAPLFWFSAVAPLLAFAAFAIVAAAVVTAYRQRHSLFQVRAIQPGDVVFRQGDVADCAYFIQKGEVELLRADDGRQRMVGRLRAGDCFGEVSLLSGEAREVTVRARAESHLAVLGKDNFLKMIFTVPSVRDELLKTARERLARQNDYTRF